MNRASQMMGIDGYSFLGEFVASASGIPRREMRSLPSLVDPLISFTSPPFTRTKPKLPFNSSAKRQKGFQMSKNI